MKRYSVSELRAHLADVLDQAQNGETVIIERRGQRFQVIPRTLKNKWPELRAKIEIHDPALLEGQWGWEWKPGKTLRFVGEHVGDKGQLNIRGRKHR